MGFDVTAFIGSDSSATVFNSNYNKRASKLYEISDNEAMNNSRDV
jgi:hypothetical protein